MAAVLYMLAARIIGRLTPQRHQTFRDLWVKPRFLTLVFVSLDILAFIVQLLGLAIAVDAVLSSQNGEDTTKKVQRALRVLKLGFLVQLATLGLFVVVVLRFQVRAKRWLPSVQHIIPSNRLLLALSLLYTSSVLLVV